MALDKKRAAAIAAVMSCIKSEEELAAAQGLAGRGAGRPSAGPAAVNLWAVSGRQAQMQLRSLMQLRSFRGTTVR